MATIGGAKTALLEQVTGSLEAGKATVPESGCRTYFRSLLYRHNERHRRASGFVLGRRKPCIARRARLVARMFMFWAR